VETVFDSIGVFPATREWRDAMPLPGIVEYPVLMIYPLVLLYASKLDSSAIRVPKRVYRLRGSFNVVCVSI
jgi:hypothetical protein